MAYPMIITFSPTRAVSQGHLGRPRRRPGTKARSASPTSRAASGSSRPIRGPARFGATVSAAPMALVTTPTRTAARPRGVRRHLSAAPGTGQLSRPRGGTDYALPLRSRCLQPGQQQGRRWPSSSSSWVRRIRRSRVTSCLASSTQQMNSFRARGVMSLPGMQCRRVGHEGVTQIAGELVHHPAGQSRATHRTTRTQHREVRHHLTARIDRSFTHQWLHRPSQHEAHRLQPAVRRPSKPGLSSRACQHPRVHGECEPHGPASAAGSAR